MTDHLRTIGCCRLSSEVRLRGPADRSYQAPARHPSIGTLNTPTRSHVRCATSNYEHSNNQSISSSSSSSSSSAAAAACSCDPPTQSCQQIFLLMHMIDAKCQVRDLVKNAATIIAFLAAARIALECLELLRFSYLWFTKIRHYVCRPLLHYKLNGSFRH